jgi:drug/metabolite transporter (DMT)-like permease
VNPTQFLLINIGALITAVGGIFLKQLSVTLKDFSVIDVDAVIKIIFDKNLWLGGLCYVVPIFFWAYLLKTMELTKLQPMLSIVYVYTVGLAYIFLGEQPTFQRLLGITVVIIGVVLIGRS